MLLNCTLSGMRAATMRWYLDQLYLIIFIGIITMNMTAATITLTSANALSQFNGFDSELQCIARMPMSELLRIKKTLQMISNVTLDVDEMDTVDDTLSARSDTIDRSIRDRIKNAFGITTIGPMLTPMPFTGGPFRYSEYKIDFLGVCVCVYLMVLSFCYHSGTKSAIRAMVATMAGKMENQRKSKKFYILA